MQVLTNERLIKSQARVSRITILGSFVILTIGLLASFRTQWLLVSYVALILGVGMSGIGIRNANKWVKEPRADQLLAREMKGFDDRHRLYNYLLPAEHVLLSPYGLFVLTVKRQEGEIRCQGERWHHEFSWRRLLAGFGSERLGNPTQELRRDMERVRQLVARHLPQEEVPIEGVIVFTNPQARLKIVNAPLPVVVIKKLKSFLRGASRRGKKMSGALRAELERVLDEEAA
ncbi:MAG: nuclease-related domain-containing protein [Anaerolineae bacterium]